MIYAGKMICPKFQREFPWEFAFCEDRRSRVSDSSYTVFEIPNHPFGVESIDEDGTLHITGRCEICGAEHELPQDQVEWLIDQIGYDPFR